MNHQSDHGYSHSGVSMHCIACGSTELDCCDGHGIRLSEVDKAKQYLARMMLNQVGVEWDDACDSVDLFVKRQGRIGDVEMINRLHGEAYRYEDM